MEERPLKSEEYETRKDSLEGWDVNITSYRVGDTFYCRVDNVSPGATVSRGEGKSREEAEREATAKAGERLAKTRRVD